MRLDVPELGERLCNWKRWGEGDESGTVNFITPDKVRDAMRLVLDGSVIELGVPLDRQGPQTTHPRRFNPIHYMSGLPGEVVYPGGFSAADDVVILPLQASTQWDALAHGTYRGIMYGGRSAALVTSAGAQANSIRSLGPRIATRAVLADVAHHKGVASLAVGHPITVGDLEACLAAEGTSVSEGDILLVRTGFLAECRRNEWRGFGGDAPGLSVTTLEWVSQHRLAGVAADTTALEVKPSEVDGERLPFHSVALVYMGLLLGEIFDLERLAQACRDDGRYECLLVAPPLPVTGGVGSPINPYAIR